MGVKYTAKEIIQALDKTILTYILKIWIKRRFQFSREITAMISNIELRHTYISVFFTVYRIDGKGRKETLQDDITYDDLMDVYKWVQKLQS